MLVKRQAASFAARLLPFLAILSNGSLLLLFVLLIALNAPALLGVVGSGQFWLRSFMSSAYSWGLGS
jgi:hypothetical protein